MVHSFGIIQIRVYEPWSVKSWCVKCTNKPLSRLNLYTYSVIKARVIVSEQKWRKLCDLNPKPKPNTLSCIHTYIDQFRQKTPDHRLLQQLACEQALPGCFGGRAKKETLLHPRTPQELQESLLTGYAPAN